MSQRASKYQPLWDWLQVLPANHAEVVLSLSAIEQIIGQPLPRSAHDWTYWAVYITEICWPRTGFTARLSRSDGGRVTFARVPG